MSSCPRRRPSSPAPVTHVVKRAKTCRSPFPSSLRTCRVPRSQRLPVSHTASAPQLNSCSIAPSSTPPLLQQKYSRCVRGESRSGFASRRACGATHDPGVPFSRDSPFNWALRFALPSMRAFATRIVPAFDADHLLAPPLALMRLTLLADTLSFSFFGKFLAAQPHVIHLALPNFVGVPPDAGEVLSTAVPHFTTLDASLGLAVALAPGCLVGAVDVVFREYSIMVCALLC